MLSFVPAAGALLSAAFIVLYKLSDAFMMQVSNDLVEKRRKEEGVDEKPGNVALV